MPQYEEIDQTDWPKVCGQCDGPVVWAFDHVEESEGGAVRMAVFNAVCAQECVAYRLNKTLTDCDPQHVEVSQSWKPTPTHMW